jgi:hypothetical protein
MQPALTEDPGVPATASRLGLRAERGDGLTASRVDGGQTIPELGVPAGELDASGAHAVGGNG